MKNKEFTTQELLSLGYIYLVILGIITDVIYYTFLNINIFEYSTILDVLITPISIMTTNLPVLIVFLVAFVLMYFFTVKATPWLHFKLRNYKWYQKTTNIEKYDKHYKNFDQTKILLQLLFMIFFMFVGFRSAKAYKLKTHIESGDIITTHSIVYSDNNKKDVMVVGQNSAYIFYITKDQKTVTISPINFNIKEIKPIKKKKGGEVIPMEQLIFKNREEYRDWLSQYHDKCDGIWIIFFKKHTGKSFLDYAAAVEEALCYGWIDSITKRIDDEKYMRKFTPRKPKSVWSKLNKQRVAKLIESGLMTDIGLAKIEIAKKNGQWNKVPQSTSIFEIPQALKEALDQNSIAKEYFDQLAPSYRKQYIGWIASAKREDTRQRRILEAISLLEKGEKLGMK